MNKLSTRRLPKNLPHFVLPSERAVEKANVRSALEAQSSLRMLLAFFVMVALGVGLALYAWEYVLKVPAERPFAGIYDETRQQFGWAPWWIAPLSSGVLAALISIRLLLRGHQLTLQGLLVQTFIVAWVSMATASFVRNAGHVLINIEGGDLGMLIAAQPRMAIFHFGQAPRLIFQDGHLVFVFASMAAAVIAFLVAGHRISFYSSGAKTEPTTDALVVSRRSQWISGMTVGVLTALAFAPFVGAAVLIPIIVVGFAWLSFGFPDNTLDWRRLMAIGCLVPAVAVAPVLLIAIRNPGDVIAMSVTSLLPSSVFTALTVFFVWRSARR